MTASSLLEQIKELKIQALNELESCSNEADLQDLKVKCLGKKGLLTEVLKGLSQLSVQEKPLAGQAANEFKQSFEASLTAKLKSIEEKTLSDKIKSESIDRSLPGRHFTKRGHLHPISLVMKEIAEFFLRFGFDIYQGPEIENDFYNFEALGIPASHPARDMQDTFYLADSALLLRTHTSPIQIRVMQKQKPPIRMIGPGAVYRKDSDLTHSPMFHQIEGLLIDEGVSFVNLKAFLGEFLKSLFGSDLAVRFRPSYFPFTEPSAEVDIACVRCRGKGCRMCKMTGWLEIMGCGMVDPVVFSSVNYDSEKLSGFAFGMGIERIAMLKYGIEDLRLFFENDLKFLQQF